jgi:hypothetical protein
MEERTMTHCTGHAAVGALLCVALMFPPAIAVAQASGNLPGPPASRAELPCADYGTNRFLSDPAIAQVLSSGGTSARANLAPPCAENVSPGEADTSSGEASRKELKALFDNSRTALERLQNGFDLYSWITFLALNSPEDRGVPLGRSDAPTVWESEFTALNQVIPQGEKLPPACAKLAAQAPAPTLFVEVDDVAFDQPFKSGPLVDQNGHYSLNTIFMNTTMREYITGHKLESAEGQGVFGHDGSPDVRIDFPVGVNPDSTPGKEKKAALGAVMIKASWKLMVKTDNPSEFHTVRVYRYFRGKEEGGSHFGSSCQIVKLGLVGIHIVHKTQGRRQWIWTTFEHERNVPSADEVKRGAAHGKAYLFYHEGPQIAKGGRPEFDATARSLAQANRTPPQPWVANAPPLDVLRVKSQIVRAQAISEDAQTINVRAHEYLRGLVKDGKSGVAREIVWRHYQLISTQWPADFGCAGETARVTNQQTDPNCSPAPEFLPNSTLETYIQHDIGSPGGIPQATSSCIACHNNAVAYTRIDYEKPELAAPCTADRPTTLCGPASDFTFILEQVCAPLLDPVTHTPIPGACKHELPDDRIAGVPTMKGKKP